MAKSATPRLMIFFDTNVLFTQVASDLVRHDVARVIKDNSSHVDLQVSWHLPDVVVDERKYQMQEKGKELLPNLQKVEKLLGHSFGVGEDTLNFHVDKAITNAITELGIEVTPVDVEKIDWLDVISRATERRPPFEGGEKEKGFRDCVIAHSFLQAHESAPSTPNICRLVFVTSDERLVEYIKGKRPDSKNIRIVGNVEELESLMNTLVSNVSEEFAKELVGKAQKLFFEKGSDKCLYFKEGIRDRIRDQYGDVLKDVKRKGAHRENGTWWISEPLFVKKEKQRVSWISLVEPEFEVFHYEYDRSQSGKEGGSYGLSDMQSGRNKSIVDLIDAISSEREIPVSTGIGGLLSEALKRKKVVDLTGREKFEVHWTATISQAKNLVKPSIDEIKYVGDTREQEEE